MSDSYFEACSFMFRTFFVKLTTSCIMSITSSSLFTEHKVNFGLNEPGILTEIKESTEEVVDEFVSEILCEKRKTNEIDLLKVKLKEKALLLEKAPSKKKNKQKAKRLVKSNKRMKLLGIHSIPREGQKYKNFIPLNELWKQYITTTFCVGHNKELVLKADERLLKVDFHGAEISVYNCKCKSYIGLKGIIVKETKNTMIIITTLDELRTIPKKGAVFMFELSGYRVKLNGDVMVGRPGVRMQKKIKPVCKADLLIG